jgi:integrase
MDPLEDELYAAFEEASGMADAVDKMLPNTQHGAGRNTRKDIRRVVEGTPIGYWRATLRIMIAEVRRGRDKGERSHLYCMLVQAAYRLAWLISTGMRWQELHHVRLDLQYDADQRRRRRCKLRPRDRKNSDEHEVMIDESFLPAWLEAEWLHDCRPILLNGHDHPWLFVTASGRPIGCVEESMDGSGRDDAGYELRLSAARFAWQAELGPWAFRANGSCPTDDGYFTPHCVRNAVGAELYARFGVQRAADYLGDDPSIVRGHYGFLSGATSRVGDLAITDDAY